MNTTEPAVTDSEILDALAQFDEDMRADGQYFNASNMWSITTDPAHADLKGDALLVGMALGSLMRKPWLGVNASHAQIATRATHLKRILSLAYQVGWARIIEVIAANEKGSE